MSDSTYLRLTCRQKDAKALAPRLGHLTARRIDATTSELSTDCANYGLSLEREEAAAKFNFHGYHDTGCEYDAVLFVALDGEHLEVAAHDGAPCVHVEREGPRENELAGARRYYELVDQLEARWRTTTKKKTVRPSV